MRWLWPAGYDRDSKQKRKIISGMQMIIVNTISMYAPTTGKNGPEPATIFNAI